MSKVLDLLYPMFRMEFVRVGKEIRIGYFLFGKLVRVSRKRYGVL